MEDYTVLIGYFEELEKFKYDTTQYTFNGSAVYDFNVYRENLTQQYNDFKNNLDTLFFGDLSTDKLMRILGVLDVRITKTLEQANVKYNKFADTFKFMVVKVEGYEPATIKSGRFTKNPELQSLDSIFQFHIGIVKLTNEVVKTRFEVIKDANTYPINEIPIGNPLNQKDVSNEPSVVSTLDIEPTANKDKLLLNLEKQDVAMLFILLCQIDIIKPKDEKHLKQFIENNFKYINNSKGKHSISDIKRINTQFSRLVQHSNKKNEKDKNKFITNYQNAISDFIERMKNLKLEDFYKAF